MFFPRLISIMVLLSLLSCGENKITSEVPKKPDTLEYDQKTFQFLNDSTYVWADSIDDKRIYLGLYPTGEVKSTENQGMYNGCGVSIGTSRFFSKDGSIMKTIEFRHWLPFPDASCHDMIQDQWVTLYHPNGMVKETQYYRSCYECETFPIGLWRVYDENGDELSSIKHPLPDLPINVFLIRDLELISKSIYGNKSHSKLNQLGFTLENVDQKGEEILFTQNQLEKQIVFSRNKFEDGEQSYVAAYKVNQLQLDLFLMDLVEKGYQEKHLEPIREFRLYSKKGLGTYESKTVKIYDCSSFYEIRYSHYQGKELSIPPPPSGVLE